MKIVHIITSLNNGGAQRVLYDLVANTPLIEHHIIYLTGHGFYASRFRDLGVDVHEINLKYQVRDTLALHRLRLLLRKINADIIHTWLYHADFVGSFIGWLAGNRRIVWGLHNSTLDSLGTPLSTRLLVRLLALMSRVSPQAVVSCSRAAIDTHVDFGYARNRFVHIPNGSDSALYHPAVSTVNGCSDPAVVDDRQIRFGCVARWSAQKDHATLLNACRLLKANHARDFHLYLVGPGMDDQNTSLRRLIEERGLTGDVSLLGPRSALADIYHRLDFHVLSSGFGEAQPNVIAEAMLSGVPCIATDVGDCSAMVSECGWVVPPRDPVSLSTAMNEAASIHGSDEWGEMSCRCRQLALNRFSLPTMISSYTRVWDELTCR